MTIELENNKKIKNRYIILIVLVIGFFILEKLFLNNIIRTEGIKFGLYNIFIIYALTKVSTKFAYMLFIFKLTVGIIVASTAVIYPLIGGALSITAMVLIFKYGKAKTGYLGLGIAGALIYNTTVYIVAAISLSSAAVFSNLPKVLILSVFLGSITGAFAYLLSKSNILLTNDGGNDEKK